MGNESILTMFAKLRTASLLDEISSDSEFRLIQEKIEQAYKTIKEKSDNDLIQLLELRDQYINKQEELTYIKLYESAFKDGNSFLQKGV